MRNRETSLIPLFAARCSPKPLLLPLLRSNMTKSIHVRCPGVLNRLDVRFPMPTSVGSLQPHIRPSPLNNLERPFDIFDATSISEAFLRQNQVTHVVRMRENNLAFALEAFELLVVVGAATCDNNVLLIGLFFV